MEKDLGTRTKLHEGKLMPLLAEQRGSPVEVLMEDTRAIIFIFRVWGAIVNDREAEGEGKQHLWQDRLNQLVGKGGSRKKDTGWGDNWGGGNVKEPTREHPKEYPGGEENDGRAPVKNLEVNGKVQKSAPARITEKG